MGEGITLSHSCTGLLASDVVHGLPCEDTDANQHSSSAAQDSGNCLGIGEIDLLVVNSDFPFCYVDSIIKLISIYYFNSHICVSCNQLLWPVLWVNSWNAVL